MKNTHRPLCLSLLAMGALSLNAQAADISNVQTTLGNLTYRLIDLDPNDGIAPAILSQAGSLLALTSSTNFSPSAVESISTYYSPDYYFPGVGYSPLTTAPTVFNNTGVTQLESPEAGTSGSISGTQLITQASLNSAQVDARTDTTTNGPYSYTDTRYDAASGTYQPYKITNTTTNTSGNSGTFSRIESTQAYLTLTPNTLLIVEGDASVSGTVNATDAVARAKAFAEQHPSSPDVSSYYGNQVYGSAQGIVSVGLRFDGYQPVEGVDENGNPITYYITTTMQNGGDSLQEQSDLYTMSLTAQYSNTGELFAGYSTLLSADADGNATFSDGEHFRVALSNLTNAAKTASLDIQTFASTNNYQSSASFLETKELIGTTLPPVDPVPNPTIPEPSTYALMALGLAGISLAGRRHRPTQKV